MIYLTIRDRDRKTFEGNVDNISLYNKKGLFDILQDHSNFISIVDKKILVRQNGSVQEIEIENGLVKVRENKVYIYIGIK